MSYPSRIMYGPKKKYVWDKKISERLIVFITHTTLVTSYNTHLHPFEKATKTI